MLLDVRGVSGKAASGAACLHGWGTQVLRGTLGLSPRTAWEPGKPAGLLSHIGLGRPLPSACLGHCLG